MAESIRVLHVDDDPGLADLAAQFLEREDDRFDVVTETSASDGLDRLAGETIDCIVSDYQMPGMDGLAFLETVRDEYPGLPFVLFTGRGSEEVASDAITAGATDYLRKGSGAERYELLANRVLNAVDQYRSKRRAAELDRIRTLASDINQALVRAESRDGIETRVCEVISDSDPYLFAWIGDVDPDTDRIEPRTSAGVEDGYLDEITVTVDDTPTGQGPGGRAIRERCVAVSQNVAEDPEFEPWRDEALERGYRAVAAVPLEYADTLYGELVVYADRPNAFDEDERALLAELGDNIAHAYHSLDVRDRLRTERDRRQALFENAPGPVIDSETRGGGDTIRVTDVNDAFEEVFGYEVGDIVGTDPADLIVPEEGMDSHAEFRKRATDGETIVTEVERVTVEGPRTFLLHIIPYGSDDGHADGMYAWYTDISTRRERERAIENLHSTVQGLMEAETTEEIAEITVDAVRDVLDMPANSVHLYDESENALPPVAWTDHAEELAGGIPTFQPGDGLAWDVFETGEAQVYNDVSTVPGRFDPDTNVRSEILLPLDGHGTLLIGSGVTDAFDETDVSLAETLAAHATAALDGITQEQALREERDFIDKALDTLDDIFYVTGPDGKLRRWNERLPEVTGYTDDDIADMEVVDLFAEDEQERVAEAIEKVLITGHTTVEADLRTVYGDRVPYEFRGVRLTDPAGDLTGIAGIGRDITERTEREKELTRQQSLFKAVMETSVEGILVVDENREYVTWNQQFIDMWGVPEELIGDEPEEEGLEYVLDHLENPGEFIDQVEYLYEHPHEESRDEIRLTDGRVFDRYSAPVRADDGTYFGRVWFFRDITEQETRERDLTRQNERLEEFAGVVSHDLRNPLSVAEGRIELAREQCDSEHLDSAADAVDRSLALIDDLLALAREGERASEVETVDLAEVCDGCWRNVETAGATLVNGTDRSIRADSGRLKQLLENLMRNAIEHGGEEVTVTIGDLEGGFYVADDGPGIPEGKRGRVFDAGYSTAEEGTGFGLNIVREIAEAHGWTIRVTDSEAGGARFEITGVESAR